MQAKSEQQIQSTQRTSKEVDVDGTKGLIAYLGLLLERQIIGNTGAAKADLMG